MCIMMEQGVQNRERYLSRGETVNQGRRESRDPLNCHQVFVDTNDNFSFLHPKNINSMIVVLVIVLGKV